MQAAFTCIDNIVHRYRQRSATARVSIYCLGRMSPADQQSARTIRSAWGSTLATDPWTRR